MSNHKKYVDAPAVLNVYSFLMAALLSLKAQYGLSELSVVVRNGKYVVIADGKPIEITFVNGNIIPVSVRGNIQLTLEQLLEKKGFSKVNPIIKKEDTINLFDNELMQDTLERTKYATVAGWAILRIGKNSSTLIFDRVYEPFAASVAGGVGASTVTVDFDIELDTIKLPSIDDFEILVNSEKTGVRSIQLYGDRVELEIYRDLQPNDWVSVRCIDQKEYIEHSIEDLNGNLASSFLEGRVIDGYVAEAQLYMDKDGDGLPDPDEILVGVTTNEWGVFIMDDRTMNPNNLPILVVGGTHTDTGLPNDMILSAPSGSAVITPTTTLIQKMVREGLMSGAHDALKAKDAEAIVKKALGFAEDIDLLSSDPLAAIKNKDNLLAAGSTSRKSLKENKYLNPSKVNSVIIENGLKRYIVTSSINDLLSELNNVTGDSDSSLILVALSESTYFLSYESGKIFNKSSMTVAGISQRLNLSEDTVSRKITKLIEMGFLDRENDIISFRLDQDDCSVLIKQHPEVFYSMQSFCEKLK